MYQLAFWGQPQPLDQPAFQVEHHALLHQFLEDGTVPYNMPDRPIPPAVVSEILQEFPDAKSIDELAEFVNAFWNLQAKHIMQGIGSPFKDKLDAAEYVRRNTHVPKLGMSITTVAGKEYIVCHGCRAE